VEMMKTFEAVQKYKVYVDLDGVLVDFDKFAREATGVCPMKASTEPGLKSKFWAGVDRYMRSGKPFFSAMSPMPDAMELWNYVKKFDPEILTATGHVQTQTVLKEKPEWVRKHLGDHIKVNMVAKSSEKAKFAGPNVILIDDRRKSIDPWVAAGGIGILHKNAADTIAQLKELGL